MRIHTVEGGGGLKLHVREWGDTNAPPILLIHGWSQHHLCWFRQIESSLPGTFRLVAMDIRGHGQSEAPLEPEFYSDGALWADDVRNVIEHLDLRNPLLVCWSYGGLIVGDYLRRYGDGAIAGVNFVNAAIGVGEGWSGNYVGPGFLEHVPGACSDDQEVALKTIRDFLHTCFVKPLPQGDMEHAVGWNMLVHPQVRANLVAREEDFTPELANLNKPVLITYGSDDTVILPAMAMTIRDHVPEGEMSEYAGTGHAPKLEEPDRFNTELERFAHRCFEAA
ncbi:MAG: alpha/beta fold hydrolase [Alphaproteobacteria bacterium]